MSSTELINTGAAPVVTPKCKKIQLGATQTMPYNAACRIGYVAVGVDVRTFPNYGYAPELFSRVIFNANAGVGSFRVTVKSIGTVTSTKPSLGGLLQNVYLAGRIDQQSVYPPRQTVLKPDNVNTGSGIAVRPGTYSTYLICAKREIVYTDLPNCTNN